MAHRLSFGLNPPFHPVVVVLLVAAYFALHLMQHYALGPELMRFYGKDVLLVPMLAAGIAISTSLAGFSTCITLRNLLLTGVYAAMVFEVILPAIGNQYQTDRYDLAAYALGVLTAWGLMEQNRRSTSSGTDFALDDTPTSQADKQ